MSSVSFQCLPTQHNLSRRLSGLIAMRICCAPNRSAKPTTRLCLPESAWRVSFALHHFWGQGACEILSHIAGPCADAMMKALGQSGPRPVPVSHQNFLTRGKLELALISFLMGIVVLRGLLLFSGTSLSELLHGDAGGPRPSRRAGGANTQQRRSSPQSSAGKPWPPGHLR